LLKLFDNVKAFNVVKDKYIKSVISDEGESFNLENEVKIEGSVENWLTSFDNETKSSLRTLTKKGVFYFGK
jgi:hypothetical protein